VSVRWVTGSEGMIGAAVARAWARDGHRVVRFCRSDHGDLASRSARRVYAEACAAGLVPQAVFHGAGLGAVTDADSPDAEAKEIGTLSALIGALQADAPHARLVYPSSVAVYGEARGRPMRETDHVAPSSGFGRLKVAGEVLTHRSSLDCAVARLFSTYGQGLKRRLPWAVAMQARFEKRVVLQGTGDEIRDFVWLDDTVRLLTSLAETHGPETVNCGTGRGVYVRDFAVQLARMVDPSVPVEFTGEHRSCDPTVQLACTERAERTHGFRANVGLDFGLRQYAAWFRAQTRAAA
jgi:UDP-glucose 4-epimerase